MQGYADETQRTSGVHTRLYARCFVVEADDGARVAIINLDIWGLSNVLHRGLMRQIKKDARLAARYSADTVALSATHTHAGVGGFSGYFAYDMATHFVKDVYFRIVLGMFEALKEADSKLQPGRVWASHVFLDVGNRAELGKQRSKEAYMANVDADKFERDTNNKLTVLTMSKPDDRTDVIGVLAFYAVHPTTLSKRNRLISGDLFGYASFVVEQRLSKTAEREGAVAAIVQTDSGDVSPNLLFPGRAAKDKLFEVVDGRGVEAAHRHGLSLGSSILDLVGVPNRELNDHQSTPSEPVEVTGPIFARKKWVTFAGIAVTDKFLGPAAGDSTRKTCRGAFGLATMAGTEDGRGIAFSEGWLREHPVYKAVNELALQQDPALTKCQAPKPIGMTTIFRPGTMKDLTPPTVPLQAVGIGTFGIAFMPFELTTMAGRRLRKHLEEAFATHGVTQVELGCLSNSYAGYTTTAEEYKKQHYEGASTLFGMNQLGALSQEMDRLVRGDGSDRGEEPEEPEVSKMWLRSYNVIMDKPHFRKKFGDVLEHPGKLINGDLAVRVRFSGTHPNNGFADVHSYCTLERRAKDGSWFVFMTDAHPSLIYKWSRVGIAASAHDCIFHTNGWDSFPEDDAGERVTTRARLRGVYRMRASGYAKGFLSKKLTKWEGVSEPFEWRPFHARIKQLQLAQETE